MKVLFVCSGNSKNFEIIPFIKEQGESLKRNGIEVDYYPIVGKGLGGYIKAGFRLRKFLKKKKYDLIHAHYTFSGWASVIGAGKLPVVLSLMGTDANGEYKGVNKVVFKSRVSALLTRLIQPFVTAIIAKSANIEKIIYLKYKSHIIPNGVNMEVFQPTPGNQPAGNRKKKVLFLGSKTKPGKNFTLARMAVHQLQSPDVELVCPYPVTHQDIPRYLNEADVLAFSSFMEGSPNVIKEAMACNCPIVSTDVGDVKWVLGKTTGCFISSFDTNDFAEKLKYAIAFSQTNGRTDGRQRIIDLGLDATTIAKRIIDVYRQSLPQSYHFTANTYTETNVITSKTHS